MRGPGPSTALPAAPPAAAVVFGDRLPLAEQYAELLAAAGVERGLLGPREVPRLWERHLLNCAVLGELVPSEAEVVDLGSGAGLPGIPLALARADLQLVLVEPMQRRVTFLEEAVDRLGLAGQVVVRRGRAAEFAGALMADVATARALAPLERLLDWAGPLIRPGGVLLALKGRTADEELATAAARLRGWAARPAEILTCGVGVVEPPTTVVRVVRAAHVAPAAHQRAQQPRARVQKAQQAQRAR